MSEAVAVVVLGASLLAAIARWRWSPDWAVAAAGAALLVALGVLSTSGVRSTLKELGPTVGFLAALLVLAWLAALLIEWLILRASFAGELRRPAVRTRRPVDRPEMAWFAVGVVALTLVGFVVSSPIGIAPVWVAAAGALVLALRE